MDMIVFPLHVYLMFQNAEISHIHTLVDVLPIRQQ